VAELVDRDRDHGVPDEGVGPHRLDQFLLADDVAGVAHQVAEHRGGFRAQRNLPVVVAPQASTSHLEAKAREEDRPGVGGGMPSGHPTSIAQAVLTETSISREIFELLKDIEPAPMFQ
jgi:hypothetical protein